jgi:anti-anti-sigma factor
MSNLANLFVWRRDNVVVVGVTGEVDVSNAHDLERTIAAEIDDGAAGLVLDLGGLEFIDSSGMHMLFGLAGTVRRRGHGFALVLTEGSAPYRVLELSGPLPLTWVHPTEEAAIAAVLTAKL